MNISDQEYKELLEYKKRLIELKPEQFLAERVSWYLKEVAKTVESRDPVVAYTLRRQADVAAERMWEDRLPPK